MEISVYKPTHSSLKPFIKYFYILMQDGCDDEVTYLTFPNPNAMLSVSDKVEIAHSPNKARITFNPEVGIISDLTMSYNQPLLVNYVGKVKEITVCFKPLGIHSFDPDLKNYIASETSFYPFADYRERMADIIAIENNEELITRLEEYLLSIQTVFSHPFLFDFVKDIEENPNASLEHLSSKYGISQKTLIKHCKAYFSRTPSEYKRVVRFHEAMAQYMRSEKKNGALTDISYTAQFFDQAHMIKDFKALTGHAPGDFFKNLNPVKGEFNWMFL